MAILWHNDPRAAERYSMAVGETLHAVESASMASRVLTADHSERLVIIGPDVELEQACDLAEIARVDRPELGVILLRHRVDVTTLAQALRSGRARGRRRRRPLGARRGAAAQPRPVPAAGRRRRPAQRAREGQIVTVFSAKGGVGKTTFSTNLARLPRRTGSQDPARRPRPRLR